MAIKGGIPSSVNPNSGIKGLDKVLSNLNKEIAKIKDRSIQGLIKVAIVVRREMDHTPPLIPVDLGNLRASWFVVTAYGLESDKPSFVGPTVDKIALSYNQAIAEAQTIANLGGMSNPIVVMGFGANYALVVHEMMGDIEWKRKNSGPKFLESAIKRNKGKIITIMQETILIK